MWEAQVPHIDLRRVPYLTWEPFFDVIDEVLMYDCTIIINHHNHRENYLPLNSRVYWREDNTKLAVGFLLCDFIIEKLSLFHREDIERWSFQLLRCFWCWCPRYVLRRNQHSFPRQHFLVDPHQMDGTRLSMSMKCKS